MRVLYLLVSIAIVGLASCGGEPTPAPTAQNGPVPLKEEVATPEEEEESYDPEIAPYLKVLDSIYSSAPMYFKDGGDRYYFYVVNGEWIPYGLDEDVADYKMGIVTDQLDTVLFVAYDKIFNPDATAKGYIEIEADGKHGLVNYRTKQIIHPKYDVIFPANDNSGIAVAIGKRGNSHYLIDPEGTEELITDRSKIPSYMGMKSELELDVNNPDIRLLTDSYTEYYTSDSYTGFGSGRGVVIPPSYFVATGFVREYITDILLPGEDGGDYYIDASNSHIEEGITNLWGINILISTFYEEAIESRGNIIQEKRIATIDNNNNIIDTQAFPDGPHSYWGLCPDSSKMYRFLTDTLLEVKDYVYNYMHNLPEYDYMPIYSYYHISQTGQINQLDSDRFFDFTKFTLISEEYFKGCYANDSIPFYSQEDDELNTYITSHISKRMLDIMRNEIYAEYGLKFKQKEWDSYFRQKPWYKPRFDNVDDKLTEIDKANLETIKRATEQLVKDPDKHLNERFEIHYPAG